MEYSLSWQNKGGVVESGMTKWILALYNDSNTLIKKVEDTNSQNLQNFSRVYLKMSLSSGEAKRQSSTGNKMIVYYDRISDATKIQESTLSFDVTNLSINIEDIEKKKVTIIDNPFTDDVAVDDKFSCSSNDPIGDGKTNVYKYSGNNEYKWISDTGKRDKILNDCSKYTYTGKDVGMVTTDEQCGVNGKRCPGTQCCSPKGWCSSTMGYRSSYCTSNKDLGNNYSTTVGGKPEYDGKEIGNILIAKHNTSHSAISSNGRCGYWGGGKVCPAFQCCSLDSYCGGSKLQTGWSRYCHVYSHYGGGWNFYYKGGQSAYDGTGGYYSPPSYSTNYKSIKDMPEVVLKCSKNDPFSKNGQNRYKWDEPSKSIKKIVSFSLPAGALQYDIADCDGVKYGGLA